MILSLTNVSSVALDFRADPCQTIHELHVNGIKVSLPQNIPTNYLVLNKTDITWTVAPNVTTKRKRPGLQGPIDDAFTDSFLFVTPGRAGFHHETESWIKEELQRAIYEWRAQFRGDAQVVKDIDLTETQIRNSNLHSLGRSSK